MFKQRINRGAAVLDEAVPGWEARIDVNALDMSALVGPCGCVLAQLFDDYFAGLHAIGIEDGADFGFSAPNYNYSMLTREWRQFITAKRKSNHARPRG